MVCSNCRRIFRATGRRPEHMDIGTIATCPEEGGRSTPQAFRALLDQRQRVRARRVAERAQDAELSTMMSTFYTSAIYRAAIESEFARRGMTPMPAMTQATIGIADRTNPQTVQPTTPLPVTRIICPTIEKPCQEIHTSCPVCLEDFVSNNSTVTTPCGHKFCLACFTAHTFQHSARPAIQCPSCRQIVIRKL